MIYEIFPIGLLDPDRVDDVLIFIRGLPLTPEDKKRLLMMWTKELGVALTRDMVERAGAD